MDVDELMRIVRAEGLDTPILYGDSPSRNEAVVREKTDSGWRVYLANERGGMIETTLKSFDNESEANEYALHKLRQGEKYRSAMAALSDRQRDSQS